MIFGRSPAVNNSISWGSYIVGLILMTCNICFSMTYFLNGMPNPEDPSALQWWGSLTASLFMSGYEAIMLGVLTTPIAWYYLIKIPNFINQFPNREAQKMIRFGSTTFSVLCSILLCVVYYIDWSTTYGGINMSDEVVNSFLATSLVVGSEVLFIGGNVCAWLAYLSRKQEDETKKEIESIHFNGSAHAAAGVNHRTPQKFN